MLDVEICNKLEVYSNSFTSFTLVACISMPSNVKLYILVVSVYLDHVTVFFIRTIIAVDHIVTALVLVDTLTVITCVVLDERAPRES